MEKKRRKKESKKKSKKESKRENLEETPSPRDSLYRKRSLERSLMQKGHQRKNSAKKKSAKRRHREENSRWENLRSSATAVSPGEGNSGDSQPYRRSLFCQPGHSGILTRVVFYGYYRMIGSLLGKREGFALLRLLLLLLFLALLSILLLGVSPVDIYRVRYASDYDRPSEIYGVGPDGKALRIAEFYRQARRVIRIEQQTDLPKVVRAFIATEDERYYSHIGVDLLGILRAAYVNLLAGQIKEGASTITQQVARLRFLSRERSFLRKLREAFLALLLEQRYPKVKILEDYLNMVPLGHGTNGVEAAARFYFDKSYDSLGWGEAAVLVALTTRPRAFSPLVNPENSLNKVGVILQKLVEKGELTIAEAEREFEELQRNFYEVLNRSPNDSAFHQRLNLYPYATAYVRNQLPEQFRTAQQLYGGGLRIYSTIVVKHQKAAQEIMIPHLRRLTKQYRRSPFRNLKLFDRQFGAIQRFSSYLFEQPRFLLQMSRAERDLMRAFSLDINDELTLMNLLTGGESLARRLEQYTRHSPDLEERQAIEGALISMRPHSGEITAVIGGSSFDAGNRQLRFQSIRRQPGSAFKPIIYSAAIEHTASDPERPPITAATIVNDSPLHFVNRDMSEYSPDNYSKEYSGRLRLREALVLSKNSVAVQIYRRAGPANINRIAEKLLQLDRMKPPRRLPQEATVALGSYGLSPLQMARAYGVFASGGREIDPYLIERILDSEGNLLYDHRFASDRRSRRQILRPGVSEIITSMLRDVVEKGTGKAARLVGRAVAGKTGTTNNNTNAWFVGYTPRLITAIYIGYDKPLSLGSAATGGNLAAPVWGRYMYRALARLPAASYDFGASLVQRIEICEDGPSLPNLACSQRLQELFLPGTEPDEEFLTTPKGESISRPVPELTPQKIFVEEELQ